MGDKVRGKRGGKVRGEETGGIRRDVGRGADGSRGKE